MMRKKDWWEKDWLEKAFLIFVGFFYGIWFVVSRTIYGICALFWKLATDVFESVYGKLVAFIAVIVFAWLIAQFSGLIAH